MAKREKKFYVVWNGRTTGIFEDWESCRAAVNGYEGARYMSFATKELALEAFHDGRPERFMRKAVVEREDANGRWPAHIENVIAVDAACNMTNGEMEYQGVYIPGGQQLFHQGPFQGGSNNIGEFLAIVHALAWCKKKHLDLPVYTDSKTAIAWVRNKKANTKVAQNHQNNILFDLVRRAETWLKNHSWTNPVLKWDTQAWGEIPADFGRK